MSGSAYEACEYVVESVSKHTSQDSRLHIINHLGGNYQCKVNKNFLRDVSHGVTVIRYCTLKSYEA